MKEPKYSVQLTWKEFNYIDSALSSDIRKWEDDIAEHGVLGNVGHLLWFTKRLRGKLQRRLKFARRARMGEKKWKAMQRVVNKFMRKVRKGAQAVSLEKK